MHLFGLKRIKPLAAARLGGFRFLRVHRREAKSAVSDVHYLRHASAMSAAIAKNMSAILSQSSELMHGSSTSDSSSFLDNHSHYSFIIVVALMSLFLVVTISATGLLLAFCRKKNTVFIAAPKSGADSQFELDDIESSDIEMCHGDKGECYMHLSDDYDENNDFSDDDYEDDDRQSVETNNDKGNDSRCNKRSRTFPQFRDVLNGCRKTVIAKKNNNSTGSEHKVQQTLIPLIQNSKHQQPEVHDRAESVSDKTNCRKSNQEDNSVKQNFQKDFPGKVICRNPNHKHHQHYHFNLQHQHQMKLYRAGKVKMLHSSRNHSCSYGVGRLQRSHTIHAIPMSERRKKLQLGPNGDHNKTNDNNANGDKQNNDTLSDLPIISQEITENSDIYILNGDEDETISEIKAPFENLKLLIQDDHEKDNLKNKNDSELSIEKGNTPLEFEADNHISIKIKHEQEIKICTNSNYDNGSCRENPNSSFNNPRSTEEFCQMKTFSESLPSRRSCTSNLSPPPNGSGENAKINFSTSVTNSTSSTSTNPFHVPSENTPSRSCTSATEAQSTTYYQIHASHLPETQQSQYNIGIVQSQPQDDINISGGTDKPSFIWNMNQSKTKITHKNNNLIEVNYVKAILDQGAISPPSAGSILFQKSDKTKLSPSNERRHDSQTKSDYETHNKYLRFQRSVFKGDNSRNNIDGKSQNWRTDVEYDSSERCHLSCHEDDEQDDNDDQTTALLK